MTRASRRRKPGRPAGRMGRTDPRESLLDAAARLYAGPGPHSLRAVAAAAGVTPAMVHYYFGDRHGLEDALLERALARVLERVSQVRRLEDLPATVAQAFGAEPWIPPLLHRALRLEHRAARAGHARGRDRGGPPAPRPRPEARVRVAPRHAGLRLHRAAGDGAGARAALRRRLRRALRRAHAPALPGGGARVTRTARTLT